MKLSARDAAAYIARPGADRAGALLHGEDAMRVALKREALVAAIIGPEGPAEMRLTRLSGGDLRRDPATLSDAVRAVGFFPGPRAVLVDEAGDGIAAVFVAVLADWRAGDARIVATAGQLGPRSALRKAFDAAGNAVSIGVYADPPGRAEIEAELTAAEVGAVSREAMADLEALARDLDPGDFRQLARKLGHYKRGDATALSGAEVASAAPATVEADLDVVLDLASDGAVGRLAAEVRRLPAGAATTLAIAAGRRFRTLHAAACAAEGPEVALARARPPVFGPRRARMAAQARALGPEQIARALSWIVEADLELRSGRPTPGIALMERLLVRIALLKRM